MTNVARLLRGLPLAAAAAAVAAAAVAAAGLPAPAAVASPAAPWWLSALHLPAAQPGAAAPGRGVTVAVLSTGVDVSHPDLAGSVTTGPDFAQTGRARGDEFWGEEGTAVASLIAGRGTDGGTAGVAPGARILSVPVTLEYDDPLNGDPPVTRRLPGAIAAGIRYAVGHGATVIALPLDPGTLSPGDSSAAGGSAAEQAAVSYALARNVVLVAPAGDDGATSNAVNYPAAYPGVIAVGATEPGGELAPFSVTRSYVAVTAPGAGGSAGAAGASPATGLTVAAPGGGYQTLASTDMSAALTAGVAALIRARYPRLTAAQASAAIERGASKPPAASSPSGRGHGALDAATALTQAGAIAATLPAAAPSTSPATTAPSPAASVPASVATPAAAAPTAAPNAHNPGHVLQSLVIGLAIAAGALIACLLAAITLTVLRRRRRAERRPDREPARTGGVSHARHARGQGVPAPPGPPAGGWQPAEGPRTENRARAAAAPLGDEERAAIWARSARFASGAPRVDPLARPPAGPATERAADGPAMIWTDRPAPRPPAPDEEPPWPPARPPGYRATPESFLPSEPAADLALPLAPWEKSPADFGPASPGDDRMPSRPLSSTGPMYVWNPAATSGPLPVAADDEADGGPAGTPAGPGSVADTETPADLGAPADTTEDTQDDDTARGNEASAGWDHAAIRGGGGWGPAGG